MAPATTRRPQVHVMRGYVRAMPVARPAALTVLTIATALALTGCMNSVAGSIVDGLNGAAQKSDDLSIEEAQGLFRETVCAAEITNAGALTRIYELDRVTGTPVAEIEDSLIRARDAAANAAGLIEQHAREWPEEAQSAMAALKLDYDAVATYWQAALDEGLVINIFSEVGIPNRDHAAFDAAFEKLELGADFDRCRP